MRRRWSDNESNFGPITYARDLQGYRPIAVLLSSGCDEYPGNSLRFSLLGHTVIFSIPLMLVKPWRERSQARSWDSDTIEKLGRDWYEEVWRRDFGFSYNDGFLQIFFGAQTHSSESTQTCSRFMPWTQWLHVRRSLYDLEGKHFWTEPLVGRCLSNPDVWQMVETAEKQCPNASYKFLDYDGEELTARTYIEEREWQFGTGWFKWLRWFRKPMLKRSLCIEFSGETGPRKGSWKGGTIGHAIVLLHDELHDQAFQRYCSENNMTFISRLC